MDATELISKYNVPGPRYTSYPTVPYWDSSTFDSTRWESAVRQQFEATNRTEGLSLYIHLPYCESLCTYCGCNKRITRNHAVEEPYVASLIKEWSMYRQLFGSAPRIAELHLGGGTPTFFSPTNLRKLMNGLRSGSVLLPDADLSFEGHPNNTTREHLEELHFLGFRRVSYGVQDLDPEVQKAINRIQPFEKVEAATRWAREAGYTSVNFDLVYGLPKQTLAGIAHTVDRVLDLMPDRIAFYSYAHVPWVSPGQRGYSEADLPTDKAKRALYELGRERLLGAGYVEVGMDHFALPDDPLCRADRMGVLHRNFMGYTARHTSLLVGLGCSSISDSWTAFAQNAKTVEEYTEAVNSGELPIVRGHVLDHEDLILRRHILDLMCRHTTTFGTDPLGDSIFKDILFRLLEMMEDGLVEVDGRTITVTEQGRPFVRNVCMALDARLHRKQPTTRIFSATV
jgi:oxygen-independent coproporphyrinogen-3 oxidase